MVDCMVEYGRAVLAAIEAGELPKTPVPLAASASQSARQGKEEPGAAGAVQGSGSVHISIAAST